MNPPAKTKIVSDDVLARASALHDAAFTDPDITKKPSWSDSVAAAQEELALEKSRPAADEPAV